MTLAEKLEAAEKAYHDLMIGRAVRVFVDQNGERVEYTATRAGQLQSYIQDLKAQVGTATRPGPMRVWL